MSNLKCFPKSKTSCPLKPWLVDFIFNYVSSHNVTANAVKIIENINEDENGNIMKLVTDGNVHIKANLTHQSIQTCIQENDDDMPPWDKALILMRKYSLSFQPKTELENCEFILIVDEFKLWDLQTGFDFKKTLHPWQSVIPVNDEPSSIGDSMGSQLLSLLAEMGQETQPEDSQPDQLPSVVDDDPVMIKLTQALSEATSSMCSTDIPPVITGPTLITDNPSLSDSLKQPFLQYIDNKDHLYILHETPESQSQQYEEYEFSSPSEVSLEFSCESSDDNSTENKMAPKPSRNDSTSQNIRQEIKSPVCIEDDSDIPTNSCILTGDKPEICENVENNVEACGNDTDTEREENPNASENNNKQAFCGSENSSNLCESDRTLAKSNSGCNSGQLNSKDFLQSYVKYLKACSTSFNPSNTKQCNIGKSKTVNSKADVLINGSIDNDHEKSTLIETNQDNVDKSLPESSESQIYTSLVENDYDSIQWWSSAEDNSCLSSEEQDKPQECEKISEDGIITESDKNQTHKTSKSDKTSKQNKRVKRNETTGENCKSDLEKISDCTSKLEDKSTPERDKIKESEFNSSDTLTDVEDNVSGTQPFSMNSSVEILESIGDTTCVGLKYKRNVSEKRENDNDNDNELSGMQPLVSQPERNSDSISTREPSDEILNSNSNNSCEIIYKSSSSCYEISEFESKNSSDSIKNIVKPVICDAQKSGNSSIIYQSTQKTASKKEMPLFPLSPIKNPKQPSTSKDKAKDSVESLVFDTEYEEELRLRELAKADPKTNLKSKDKSTSKFGNSSYNLPASGKALNELGMKEKVIQNEHADKSDKSNQEKLSKTTVFNSDKASNSDLLLIKAAQSAEKGFPLKITENSNSTKCQTLQTSVTVNPSPSEKISSKPFQTQKVISDKDPEIVHPLEENHVEKSVPESNSKLSESVIIIVSSESISSNSEESRYSQNVVSFCTSPSKKCPSQVAKRKTKANVLAMDTEPNIIDESQDIPTSEVNNSILNRTTLCARNDSRLPEHAMRNVPQYFEELFEEEPPSELQRKLLNFKILSDKFDSIHKYIHK
ncbi:hypothetical protein LOTGIDRAFT_158982 [Lottia gigantea]|uniref:Shelterin complex subunit TPP1/Est3 domain-containing protein n=1 Tax=Lottia gigantea TaxID=225164 RepID=V4ATG5_LOTGI|nr:hypothetical protein LOTGIDRAFT_158982 [Lottia gigantea]ESO98195.1 hypothetical protein LOTGIDRAFT_158982 [Lottia gigantea]